MKSIVAHVLTLCAVVLTISKPVQSSSHQVYLADANDDNMGSAQSHSVNNKVEGHSDATYGPVPKEDQVFNVEFLEISPTPILA